VFTYHNGQAELEVLDELKVDQRHSIGDITQEVYKTLEQRILEQPEQWALWMDYHLMLSSETRGRKPTHQLPAEE
jgi:lauroyl/myristoyl acyltransferase